MSREYYEGWDAYLDDKLLVDCPYTSQYEHEQALEWRQGWDDSWYKSTMWEYSR